MDKINLEMVMLGVALTTPCLYIYIYTHINQVHFKSLSIYVHTHKSSPFLIKQGAINKMLRSRKQCLDIVFSINSIAKAYILSFHKPNCHADKVAKWLSAIFFS